MINGAIATIERPVARPSKPSDKLTPLLSPVNYKNITNPNLILITIVLVGYSLIGFIDDALIILKHQNEGLKAWQKFLMQAILAVGCYLYLENFVPGFTTEVTIPIVKVNIDFGWFYAVIRTFALEICPIYIII